MKKLFLISLIIVQSCIAFAQNYCVNDTIVREIQFPLTLQDFRLHILKQLEQLDICLVDIVVQIYRVFGRAFGSFL